MAGSGPSWPVYEEMLDNLVLIGRFPNQGSVLEVPWYTWDPKRPTLYRGDRLVMSQLAQYCRFIIRLYQALRKNATVVYCSFMRTRDAMLLKHPHRYDRQNLKSHPVYKHVGEQL